MHISITSRSLAILIIQFCSAYVIAEKDDHLQSGRKTIFNRFDFDDVEKSAVEKVLNDILAKHNEEKPGGFDVNPREIAGLNMKLGNDPNLLKPLEKFFPDTEDEGISLTNKIYVKPVKQVDTIHTSKNGGKYWSNFDGIQYINKKFIKQSEKRKPWYNNDYVRVRPNTLYKKGSSVDRMYAYPCRDQDGKKCIGYSKFLPDSDQIVLKSSECEESSKVHYTKKSPQKGNDYYFQIHSHDQDNSQEVGTLDEIYESPFNKQKKMKHIAESERSFYIHRLNKYPIREKTRDAFIVEPDQSGSYEYYPPYLSKYIPIKVSGGNTRSIHKEGLHSYISESSEMDNEKYLLPFREENGSRNTMNTFMYPPNLMDSVTKKKIKQVNKGFTIKKHRPITNKTYLVTSQEDSYTEYPETTPEFVNTFSADDESAYFDESDQVENFDESMNLDSSQDMYFPGGKKGLNSNKSQKMRLLYPEPAAPIKHYVKNRKQYKPAHIKKVSPLNEPIEEDLSIELNPSDTTSELDIFFDNDLKPVIDFLLDYLDLGDDAKEIISMIVHNVGKILKKAMHEHGDTIDLSLLRDAVQQIITYIKINLLNGLKNKQPLHRVVPEKKDHVHKPEQITLSETDKRCSPLIKFILMTKESCE